MKVEYLAKPGTAGVRASVIDEKGNFLKEAIELEGPSSYHITNYNSPGATGAPAFSAWIVNKLATMGRLDHLHVRSKPFKGLWDYESVSKAVGGSSSATTVSIAAHS
jgi:L-2-hydroxyglutarate oxidase